MNIIIIKNFIFSIAKLSVCIIIKARMELKNADSNAAECGRKRY